MPTGRACAFALAICCSVPLAAQPYPDVVSQSRYVAVRDGTRLAVSIYRPATGRSRRRRAAAGDLRLHALPRALSRSGRQGHRSRARRQSRPALAAARRLCRRGRRRARQGRVVRPSPGLPGPDRGAGRPRPRRMAGAPAVLRRQGRDGRLLVSRRHGVPGRHHRAAFAQGGLHRRERPRQIRASSATAGSPRSSTRGPTKRLRSTSPPCRWTRTRDGVDAARRRGRACRQHADGAAVVRHALPRQRVAASPARASGRRSGPTPTSTRCARRASRPISGATGATSRPARSSCRRQISAAECWPARAAIACRRRASISPARSSASSTITSRATNRDYDSLPRATYWVEGLNGPGAT